MPLSPCSTGVCRSFLPLRRTVGAVLLLAATSAAVVPSGRAQVSGGFSLVTSFGGSNGSAKVSDAAVIQDANGSFFGTTQAGGGRQAGTVFSLDAAGTLSNFHAFNGNDGAVPVAPLVQDAAGNFYGTAEQGGYYGYGTIFRLAPGGTLTVLHDFGSRDDGVSPEGALVFGADGNLYGTTSGGGYYNSGTVFRLATDGTGYTIGYDFGSSRDDAATPNAALVAGTDGNLYGTTTNGGYYDYGTVFQVTTDGTLTILYDFEGRDGDYPDASLVQANDGNFYGTTSGGGPYDAGTVFRLTTGGALTTLYGFPSKNDGLQPEAALIQATDGLLYGTTYYGGTAGGGAVFSIALDGSGYVTQHSFAGGDADGANPAAAVFQARDGTLYGTTAYGGTARVGTVFRLALGLPGTTVGTTPVVTASVKGLGTAIFDGHKARFLVSRTGADFSQSLTVAYTLGGTAVNGVDYRALSGTIAIPAGSPSVRVPVAPLFEETGAKTVTLTLGAPTDGSYTLGGSQGGTVEIVP